MIKFVKFVCKFCSSEFYTNDWSWDGYNQVAGCPLCHRQAEGPMVKILYPSDSIN